MPTISISAGSCGERFPVGTTVSIYPANTIPPGSSGPPITDQAAIASAAVAADNSFSVTNAGILVGVPYVAYALVGGAPRAIRVRSTLDVTDRGQAVASAVTTTNGSPTLTSVTLTSGRLEIGQRITAVGVPSGTRVVDVPTATSVTMSANATASGTVAATLDGQQDWGARRDARKAAAGAI